MKTELNQHEAELSMFLSDEEILCILASLEDHNDEEAKKQLQKLKVPDEPHTEGYDPIQVWCIANEMDKARVVNTPYEHLYDAAHNTLIRRLKQFDSRLQIVEVQSFDITKLVKAPESRDEIYFLMEAKGESLVFKMDSEYCRDIQEKIIQHVQEQSRETGWATVSTISFVCLKESEHVLLKPVYEVFGFVVKAVPIPSII